METKDAVQNSAVESFIQFAMAYGKLVEEHGDLFIVHMQRNPPIEICVDSETWNMIVGANVFVEEVPRAEENGLKPYRVFKEILPGVSIYSHALRRKGLDPQVGRAI